MLTRRTIHAGVLFLACLAQIPVGACGASPVAHTATPPNVYYVPVQSLPHDRGFTVAGRVPQLRQAGPSEAVLNELLRSAVEQGIEQAEKSVRPTSGRFTGEGEFAVIPDRSLILANLMLVSVLLPVTESRPYGTSAPYWLSLTVEPSSPRSIISISDVIRAAGFDRLAKSIRARLTANKCVVQWGSNALSSATAPRAGSFRQFALLPAGLAVGFPSRPGGPLYACGNSYVVIPYSDLVGVLSPAGQVLARDVRRR